MCPDVRWTHHELITPLINPPPPPPPPTPLFTPPPPPYCFSGRRNTHDVALVRPLTHAHGNASLNQEEEEDLDWTKLVSTASKAIEGKSPRQHQVGNAPT